MLEMEAAQADADLTAGKLRLLDLRQQERDVEADLAKLQAEGPANHRKRDHLDKACLAHAVRSHAEMCHISSSLPAA